MKVVAGIGRLANPLHVGNREIVIRLAVIGMRFDRGFGPGDFLFRGCDGVKPCLRKNDRCRQEREDSQAQRFHFISVLLG